MIEIDTSGLRSLSATLTSARARTIPRLLPTVRASAQAIKEDWAEKSKDIGHAPFYHRSITYDIEAAGFTVSAVVGPDKRRRQGALGNILEFGTRRNAPRPDGVAAFTTELSNFERALAAAETRRLFGG